MSSMVITLLIYSRSSEPSKSHQLQFWRLISPERWTTDSHDFSIETCHPLKNKTTSHFPVLHHSATFHHPTTPFLPQLSVILCLPPLQLCKVFSTQFPGLSKCSIIGSCSKGREGDGRMDTGEQKLDLCWYKALFFFSFSSVFLLSFNLQIHYWERNHYWVELLLYSKRVC